MSMRNWRSATGRDFRPVAFIFLACLFCVLLPLSLTSQPSPFLPTLLPGQSATVLPDGRWLLIGGESDGRSLSEVAIWDPHTSATTRLDSQLQHARAWHSATMLPDGTVLILGGVAPNGRIVTVAELFNPDSWSSSVRASIDLAGRAYHTATLITDGDVLIAGGIGENGQTLDSAELFDPVTFSSVTLQPLTSSRRSHTARLLADGRVLLRGGIDGHSNSLDNGELYNPSTLQISPLSSSETQNLESEIQTLFLAASHPNDGSLDIEVDAILAFRFSRPLRPQTVNSDTLTLSGPNGIEKIKIVVAEGGLLAFATPDAELLSGTTYNVNINGPADNNGILLPVSGISFRTKPSELSSQSLPSSPSASQPSDGGSVPPSDSSETSDDDWIWTGALKDGKPHSPWQDLPPLEAPPGVTAVAGQALDLRGLPLANVTLQIESEYGAAAKTTQTDETGRFLLPYIDAGWHELIIDGRRARNPKSNESPKWGYGVYEYGLEIKEGETNVLPFTIWLTKIDTENAVRIPSPTTSEVILTSPRIPGLELRLPPTTVIYDHEWQIVDEVSLTPIPLDRTPFPLPANVEVPLYFTAQPGGAYIRTSAGIGARIHYPNRDNRPPGERAHFWHYEPKYKGWYVYGLGRVNQEGSQIIPDEGISVYKFTGAMVGFPGSPPAKGKKCRDNPNCDGGEPVDLQSGLFIHHKTDLVVSDIIPIKITRTYRNEDSVSRPFGRGATFPYEMFLTGDNTWYSWMELILPDGGRVRYDRITPVTWPGDFVGAVLEATKSPTFYKSRIAWNGAGWDLTLKDGTTYVFGDSAPLSGIRDRHGNEIRINRVNGQLGNIARITASPSGRWVDFTYDASNRITQVRDIAGRTANYEYDASGRLWKVTDPQNGITEYTYDASHRMLTIKDPRGIVFLTNEYDAAGRVIKQTQADQTTFLFNYTLSGSDIIQTDVTDPRGNVRRVKFNADGQLTENTSALGTPEEQTTTYERQAGTNLLLSATDALVINSQNRKTSHTYNSKGNVLTVTRMAQAPADAVTTTYTYEPTFNQVATITDPLNHTTTFFYDSFGSVERIRDANDNETTFQYNASGQPTSITSPAGTTQFIYDFGDLVSIIDPLGDTTNRKLDSLGRLANITNPLGLKTSYSYDTLNRLTQVTDATAGVTGFSYDPNGNLLTVTDARNNTTTYTYNNMDRLETRKDPLLKVESYQYNGNGSLAQFTDRKLQPTTYTYDALDRRTGVTYTGGSTTTYTYDAGNRLTQIVDSISDTITRTYDGLDRLTSETTPQGSVTYTYDAAGRRTSMTVFGQPSVVYTYDNANRLTQITQGSSVVTFTYDNANRRTSVTLSNGILVEYAYDAASRVTAITYKQGANLLGNLTYEYDKAGNRTKIGGSFAHTGIPQTISSTAYNAANHQTTFADKTLTYDDNGNLTSIVDAAGTTLYTWNARNQLTGISGPGVNASFVYDGLGRREKKTINGSLTEFLYDGVNPVQETSGATVLANVLPGLGIDEFFSRTDVAAALTSHLLPDGLGSTLALTDSAGTVQSEYTYDPFGRVTLTGAANTSSYQYTGRENDGTGLYYYRARYYHPVLQRFITEDPIGLKAGDVNFYVYVRNNPVLFTDPTGEFWGTVVWNTLKYFFGFGLGTAINDLVQGGPQCFGGCPAHAPEGPGYVPPPPRSKSDNSFGPDDQCSGGLCWPVL